MGTALAKKAAVKPLNSLSLVAQVAANIGLDERVFYDTLKSTIMPGNATAADLATFLVACKEYELNPLTAEIYAFPKKGGGIQAVVGIDGWAKMVNRHPLFNGADFDYHEDAKGELEAITCRIHVKGRDFPVAITEYMAECKRETAPWKSHKRRMLRHKAFIQGARIALGIVGVVDEDEAAAMGAVAPVKAGAIIDASAVPPAPLEPMENGHVSAGADAQVVDAEAARQGQGDQAPAAQGEPEAIPPAADGARDRSPDEVLADFEDACAAAKTDRALKRVWQAFEELMPEDVRAFSAIYDQRRTDLGL